MDQKTTTLILPAHLMRKVQFARDQNKIKGNETLRKILDCIDLTSLTGMETEQDIRLLCQKATLYNVASVCVMPEHVKTAASYLKNTGINVATVINYPYGNKRTGSDESISNETTKHDIERAISDGARQIDIVYPFSEGAAFVKGVLSVARKACSKEIMLKTILETSIYINVEALQEAAELAIACGVDCLKTSTGKHALGGATPEAVAVIMEVIKNERRSVGVKITGGLSTMEDCIPYLALRKLFFGANRITPQNFRFGASRLLDNIVAEFSAAALDPSSEDRQSIKPERLSGIELVTFG
ncbi:MAG: deoxyribose-phosphate aldolase [Pseudobdellovibrionaceae bacterium]|jgi:deoxyribose-phosphate aldolase|nr:deoxyribose-phosphate aldolase [Pseudobdellovibrionaceae bacterium]